MEIEIDEDTVSELTEDEAWNKISVYEGLLVDMGISARNRLRKSLFEMYYREPK